MTWAARSALIRLRQSSRRPGMAGGGEAVFLCLCMAPTLRRITGTFNTPSRGCCDGSRDRQDLLAYYAKDGPAHREVSCWASKGTEALGLSGSVDPDTFRQILEGRVPDEPQLGRRAKGGEILHRPGRDVAFSAPKSVLLLAMVGGDDKWRTMIDDRMFKD